MTVDQNPINQQPNSQGSQQPDPTKSGQAKPQGDTPDRGFPENTAIADMTDGQRAAYYKFQNRQAENRLEAFKGVKPEDVSGLQARIAELERERLTAEQRAAADAAEQAKKAARAEADAEWAPKLQAEQLKAIASGVLSGDKLKSFLATTDPKAFTTPSGDLDEPKVQQHLAVLFGAASGERRNWGQHGERPPAKSGRDLATAEAERRGWIKKE